MKGLAAIVAGVLTEPLFGLAEDKTTERKLPYKEKTEYRGHSYTRTELLGIFKEELGEKYSAMQKDKEKMKYWNALWESAKPDALKVMIEQYDPKLTPLKENPDISNIPEERLELYKLYLPWINLNDAKDKQVIMNYDKSMSPLLSRQAESILRYLKSKD